MAMYSLPCQAVKLLLCFYFCWQLPATVLLAQSAKAVALPDFVYTYQSAQDYRWKKVCEVKGRMLFGNCILADDSSVYSFGGFDTRIA